MPRAAEDPLSESIACWVFGVGSLVTGLLWIVSVPEDVCPCDSVHCCSLDKACPLDAPCLCPSADCHSTNNTCAPMISSYDKTYIGQLMKISEAPTRFEAVLKVIVLVGIITIATFIGVVFIIDAVLRALRGTV